MIVLCKFFFLACLLLWSIEGFTIEQTVTGSKFQAIDDDGIEGCTDLKSGWMDIDGDGCATYEQMEWCTVEGGYGEGWSEGYGLFTQFAADGVDATQACCACGGGTLDASFSSGPRTSRKNVSESCGTVNVFIGSSNTSHKTISFDTTALTCPPRCGQGCCVNKDYSTDAAEFTIFLSPGFITVVREDIWQPWKMMLLIPCFRNSGCKMLSAATPKQGGEAYGMGLNYDGQVGVGEDQQRVNPPVLIELSKTSDLVTDVALGGKHSAFIAGSALFICGSNSYGQLGMGHTINLPLPALLAARNRQPVSKVSLGGQHSAFIAGGELYMFGDNSRGQLGFGDNVSRLSPQLLSSPFPTHTITMVALGRVHSAIIAGRILFTFGDNKYGQLGVGSNASCLNSPHAVPQRGNGPDGDPVENVVLGGYRSFMLAGGFWYAFGDNRYGALGLGSIAFTNLPVLFPFTYANITTVALGLSHTAIIAGGQLYMFGLNNEGQLGLSNLISYNKPQLLKSPNNASVTAVALGDAHTAFVAGGQLFMCGRNVEGQLGLPVLSSYTTPTLVTAQIDGAVFAVALGGRHSSFITEPTNTPTPTMTSSPSRTSTPVPTLTPTLTNTRPFPTCNGTVQGLTLLITDIEPCIQAITIPVASDIFFSRHLLVRHTPSALLVRVEEGCQNVTPPCPKCPSCIHEVVEGGVLGTDEPVHLAKGNETKLLVVLGSLSGNKGSKSRDASTSDSAAVEVAIVSSSSWVLVLLSGLLGAILLPLMWVVCHTAKRLLETHSKYSLDWRHNVRLGQPRVKACLMLGLCVSGAGTGWCLVVALTTDAALSPLILMIGGFVLIATGVLIQLAVVLWVLQDPIQHYCPACNDPVSRWRFCGTYLPPAKGETAAQKAHTRHAKCIICSRVVILDRWPEAPPHRPYHEKCWRRHCRDCTQDITHLNVWCTAQREQVTDAELVHMLAAAVLEAAHSSVAQLLILYPYLHALPIAEEDGLTAMHLSARTGDVQLLNWLVWHNKGPFDPPCLEDSASHSLLFTLLEHGNNDLYLYQPTLLYNGQPVYIGQSHGKYLYYYLQQPEDNLSTSSGWCLSSHLGGLTGALRLHLSDLDNIWADREEASEGIQHCVRSHLWETVVGTWHLSKKTKMKLSKKKKSFVESDAEPMLNNELQSISVSSGGSPSHGPTETWLTTEETGMKKVPHGISMLQVAVAAGQLAMVNRLLGLYKENYSHCLRWKYQALPGFWEDYPGHTQIQIAQAMVQKEGQLVVSTPDFTARIDLRNMQHITPTAVQSLRSVMQPMLQHLDSTTGDFMTTSQLNLVQNWGRTFVLMTPEYLAKSALDNAMLNLLSSHGFVEYPLWAPPCKDAALCRPQSTCLQYLADELLRQEVAAALQVALDKLPLFQGGAIKGRNQAKRPAGPSVGLGDRLTDGLANPVGVQGASPPQATDCVGGMGTLPFCAKLPQNEVNLRFAFEPIVEMAADAILKVYELGRQRCPTPVQHAVVIYVYTYELQYDSEDGGDQIYGAMNKAMRLQEAEGLEFWKPLIWQLSVALQSLPPNPAKLYRGIDCQFDSDKYRMGEMVCWPSFSSATRSQRVAERFAGTGKGTLFFLQGTTARAISHISRFPEEEEMLFLPNTTFGITSTLYGASDIGQFYSRIDNIAMQEQVGSTPSVRGLCDPPVGCNNLLVQVPEPITLEALSCLANMPSSVVRALEWLPENPEHIRAKMVMGLNPQGAQNTVMQFPNTFSSLEQDDSIETERMLPKSAFPSFRFQHTSTKPFTAPASSPTTK